MSNSSSHFETIKPAKYGRIGNLMLAENRPSIKTPVLFPVVNFITGTTARGGGIWKYVLQADVKNSLLRRNVPVISQVLHFLDFESTTPKVLKTWREQSIPVRYNEEIQPPLNYSAPIFLDSGGFKLLWNDSLDLSAYDLSIENGNGPRTIFNLQMDLGGDIIASLDYPLPPGLDRTEALERMGKSRDNAIQAALLLEESVNKKPFLFVAAHGQDKETIGHYIQLVFQKFKENGLSNFNFGIAVGSLVPLRGSKKYHTIVEILQGVVENIPDEFRDTTPIHVFGVTGNLIPTLAYLGIDSFDSSTYVQEARSLKYIDPQTRKSYPILEMEDWACTCRICRETTLTDIQEALTSPIRFRPLPNGHYKSKYYGDIALHNLELDLDIVNAVHRAIKADSLQEYLLEHIKQFPQLQPCIEAIAQTDKSLQSHLTKTIHLVKTQETDSSTGISISLKHTPDDFNILVKGYVGPPASAQVLLIIPCSKGKPYSESRTHQFMTQTLEDALGESAECIHKVILSGLYGPVPEEYENEEAVKTYDFQLQPYNKDQIALLVNRVAGFLEKYKDQYVFCLGYATSKAYREVLEQVAKQNQHFLLLPKKPKSRRLTEFFRHKNVEELIKILSTIFDTNQYPQ